MLVRTALIVCLTLALASSHVVLGQSGSAVTTHNTTVRIAPTRHEPLPTDVSQYWYVPSGLQSKAHVPPASALSRVARGIQLINSGDFANGLPLVNGVDLGKAPMAAYAQYYAGVAFSNLSKTADAEAAFKAAKDRKPQGFLKEAVSLRLAEIALARGDAKRALDLLDDLGFEKAASPDAVLMLTGRAAEQKGDTDRALEAYRRAYYDYPLSAGAADAQVAINRLQTLNRQPADKVKRDRDRADALFAAKRWAQARAAYEPLTRVLTGAEAKVNDLRLAECDYYLDKFRAAREQLSTMIDGGPNEAEARYFHLSATRQLGDPTAFVRLATKLADDHPNSPWTEEALNALASYYIRDNDDDAADAVFRTMAANFPRGRYAERAALRIGWRAYRQGQYREAATTFENAAATFPRADNRPLWLYWSARSHDRLNEASAATDLYAVVIADYGNSYYGRLAVDALGGRRLASQTVVPAALATSGVGVRNETIPSDGLIRDLVALQLYEDALREVQYAQRHWGDSSQLQATSAFIRHNQGLSLRGDERFNAVRGAITTMRRAYPQFMASGGEDLPADVLRIIFPIDYWPLITKYSKLHDLDPFLVAALMAQESTFTAEIRSSANAYGLMQLIPATGSRYAKKLGIRNFSTRMLTDPETNIKLGTQYFKDLMDRFGGAHYALAGYNAGEARVQQWLSQRPPLPADEFTDDIPFAETQGYVKRILGTAEDYRRLYGTGLLDPNDSLSAQAADAVRGVATIASNRPSSSSTASSSAKKSTSKAPAKTTSKKKSSTSRKR
jgi:soluble lytic murein transglycosylase